MQNSNLFKMYKNKKLIEIGSCAFVTINKLHLSTLLHINTTASLQLGQLRTKIELIATAVATLHRTIPTDDRFHLLHRNIIDCLYRIHVCIYDSGIYQLMFISFK